MSLDRIQNVERHAAAAWPAQIVQPLDGWLLRWNHGVTRRANSVWPNDWVGEVPLEERLARVVEFYRQYGLPARYQICPAARPNDLDAILASRGYRVDAPTSVQVAPVGVVCERCQPVAELQVTIAGQLDEEWFATYCLADGVGERESQVRQGVLQRIAVRTGFALARQEGEPIAVGLGVVAGGWVGIFCMGTRAEFRRRGAARTVLGRLAEFAAGCQADNAYLQVMENNHTALALYSRAGFQTLYGYRYREAVPWPRESRPDLRLPPCDFRLGPGKP